MISVNNLQYTSVFVFLFHFLYQNKMECELEFHDKIFFKDIYGLITSIISFIFNFYRVMVSYLILIY